MRILFLGSGPFGIPALRQTQPLVVPLRPGHLPGPAQRPPLRLPPRPPQMARRQPQADALPGPQDVQQMEGGLGPATSRARPILDDQPVYPVELPTVIGDQAGLGGEGMAGDQQIIAANHLAPRRQTCSWYPACTPSFRAAFQVIVREIKAP